MALVSCRECGEEVSTGATTCPHCGVAEPAPGLPEGTAPHGGPWDDWIRFRLRSEAPELVARKVAEHGPSYDAALRAVQQEQEQIDSRQRRKQKQARQTVDQAKSDMTAGCLGLLLGPVGLWYKRNWAAGFAWLVMAILLGVVSGGLLAPVLWLGMAIHAYQAEPQ